MPSIAVLPFANVGGDPELSYLVDGLSEDIITDLSRFRQLRVIARDSCFRHATPAPICAPPRRPSAPTMW